METLRSIKIDWGFVVFLLIVNIFAYLLGAGFFTKKK